MSVGTTRGLAIARRALWIIPILGAVIGLLYAFAAVQTDDLTLAVDPCASSFDNPFTRFSQLAFLVGVGGSVALLIVAAVRKDRVGMGLAVAAAVGGIVIMLFGLLVASAGYGWHCPNY